jgi:hypothetical protein
LIMSNRLVRIRQADDGLGLIVTKSKGELFVRDISEALESKRIEDVFIMAVAAYRFDGYVGEAREVTQVKLYRIGDMDACPVCGKAWEKMRDDYYDAAYKAGYQAGKDEAGGGV